MALKTVTIYLANLVGLKKIIDLIQFLCRGRNMFNDIYLTD